MPRCIFCKSTTNSFNTREHVLPESLGGGDWAILPDGLFCDKCQNLFGSSVEQQALLDYPFSLFRVFLGIPTKKGKAPWFNSWEGKMMASHKPGIIGYEPADYFKGALEAGRKSQLRILAQPIKPNMICRFLVKMGIEVVAKDNPEEVFDKKFDNAREFALLGEHQHDWWYLQHEDLSTAPYYMMHGVTIKEWSQNIKIETIVIEDNAEVFHFKLLYLDFFTPLDPRIKPSTTDIWPEPEYRLFHL